MDHMDYAVVNIGEREVKHGYENFAKRAGDSRLRFISANIIDKSTGEPIFEPHAVVEAEASGGGRKLRVGVIGVVRFNPSFQKPGPDDGLMVIAHPKERIETELAALKKQDVDIVVLLAALHQDDAKRLVSDVEGIDFIVGSYGGFYTTRSEQIGPTWLFYAGNQGKRVGETRVFLDRQGAVADQRTTLHLLTSQYPPDPAMTEFLVAVRDEVRLAAAARAPSAAGPFVGSSGCQKCHAQAHEQWSTTAHASAYESLVREKKDGERACRACHTTGAGQAGGFQTVAATPGLAGVGCESCHGAGRAHADRPRKGYGRVTVGLCVACHDSANSPDFNYYSYLPRVNHTKRAARGESP
jgi:2',3'-cyclic-nucleotide 2'-phosphodiesterase (5'-nucleotidase family)